MISVSFSLCCSLFMIIISIVYFLKKKIKNFDNKLYSAILILNLIGLFIDIAGYFSFRKLGSDFIINRIISKVYLTYYISYIFCLMIYVYNLSFRNLSKILKKVLYIFIAFCLLIFCLPIEIHFENNVAYTFGLSVNVAYTLGFAFIGVMIFCLIKNIKNVRTKEYIPLFVFVILTVLCMFIQKVNPEITLLLTSNSIVTLLMYFTIENPDIKLLSEVYKNKELVEQTYEDKSNFLFELTGEVRNPLLNINNICTKIRDEKDINKIKEGLKEITSIARQLDFIVNDVMNVSNLSVQKIKFIDNRYSVNRMYDEIISKINSCKNENVDFITSISHNIPYLYGDYIKLKQILLSILLNAVKKTEKGFIEFHVDTIDRFDVCRLIFNIKDSGMGISIDKINEILSATGELNQEDIENMEKMDINMKLCQKVIKLMGGSIMIKSELGKGTDVMLVIDQRVHVSNTQNITENNFQDYINKNVLIVCQDKEISKQLKKKYADNNISCSHVLYGMDAVDKIKRGKKYDYIIVEDEMNEMSGYTTLQELKRIDKFDIPVIVMLKKNKEEIKEHYINDGFKDYLLLEDFSQELDRIINKY